MTKVRLCEPVMYSQDQISQFKITPKTDYELMQFEFTCKHEKWGLTCTWNDFSGKQYSFFKAEEDVCDPHQYVPYLIGTADINNDKISDVVLTFAGSGGLVFYGTTTDACPATGNQ